MSKLIETLRIVHGAIIQDDGDAISQAISGLDDLSKESLLKIHFTHLMSMAIRYNKYQAQNALNALQIPITSVDEMVVDAINNDIPETLTYIEQNEGDAFFEAIENYFKEDMSNHRHFPRIFSLISPESAYALLNRNTAFTITPPYEETEPSPLSERSVDALSIAEMSDKKTAFYRYLEAVDKYNTTFSISAAKCFLSMACSITENRDTILSAMQSITRRVLHEYRDDDIEGSLYECMSILIMWASHDIQIFDWVSETLPLLEFDSARYSAILTEGHIRFNVERDGTLICNESPSSFIQIITSLPPSTTAYLAIKQLFCKICELSNIHSSIMPSICQYILDMENKLGKDAKFHKLSFHLAIMTFNKEGSSEYSYNRAMTLYFARKHFGVIPDNFDISSINLSLEGDKKSTSFYRGLTSLLFAPLELALSNEIEHTKETLIALSRFHNLSPTEFLQHLGKDSKHARSCLELTLS